MCSRRVPATVAVLFLVLAAVGCHQQEWDLAGSNVYFSPAREGEALGWFTLPDVGERAGSYVHNSTMWQCFESRRIGDELYDGVRIVDGNVDGDPDASWNASAEQIAQFFKDPSREMLALYVRQLDGRPEVMDIRVSTKIRYLLRFPGVESVVLKDAESGESVPFLLEPGEYHLHAIRQ